MSTRFWLNVKVSSACTVTLQARAPPWTFSPSTSAFLRVPFVSLTPGLNSAVAAALEQRSPLLFASNVAVHATVACARDEQRNARRTRLGRTKFFIDIPDAEGR